MLSSFLGSHLYGLVPHLSMLSLFCCLACPQVNVCLPVFLYMWQQIVVDLLTTLIRLVGIRVIRLAANCCVCYSYGIFCCLLYLYGGLCARLRWLFL